MGEHSSGGRGNQYVYLLVGLTLYLVMGPVLREFSAFDAALLADVAMLLFLVAGVWSLLGSRKWMYWGVALAVSSIAIYAMSFVWQYPELRLVTYAIVLVFCFLSAWIALRDVIWGGAVDLNRLMGAVCVYLLIGIIWAILFTLVHFALPDPAFEELTSAGEVHQADAFIYYSFVTLTTLGYGDISPDGPITRMLAYMEAVVGQLYLAILVASLVGMLKPREST